MIKWVTPQYLYLLLLIPVLICGIIVYVLRKRSRLGLLADAAMVPRITGSVSRRLQVLQLLLMVFGFAFLIVALARPKWGEKIQIYKGEGIDVIIALDASKSMLAQDIKPNRLSRAKTEISMLLDNLIGDRVGITAFAGDCYVMCPLTSDIDAAKLFLGIVSPEVVPRPGTNLGRAIEVSNSLFNQQEDTYKALVLFTDGDNLVGDPMTAIDRIKSAGVRLFAVGMGTLEGSPVPEFNTEGNFVSYKKDKEDRIVMSRLSERLLVIMAKATDGRYFRTEGNYTNRLVAELDKIKKKEIGGSEYIDYEERYQYFLVPAFVLLFLGLFVNDRKGRWFSNEG